jgi:hypothetical protein
MLYWSQCSKWASAHILISNDALGIYEVRVSASSSCCIAITIVYWHHDSACLHNGQCKVPMYGYCNRARCYIKAHQGTSRHLLFEYRNWIPKLVQSLFRHPLLLCMRWIPVDLLRHMYLEVLCVCCFFCRHLKKKLSYPTQLSGPRLVK